MTGSTYEIVDLDGTDGVVHVAAGGERHVIDIGARGTFASHIHASIARHVAGIREVSAAHAAAACDMTPFVQYLRDRSGDGHRFGDLHDPDPRGVAYGTDMVRKAVAASLTEDDAFRVAMNFVREAEVSGDMRLCLDFEPVVDAYAEFREDPACAVEAAADLESRLSGSAPLRRARIEAWRENLDAEPGTGPSP